MAYQNLFKIMTFKKPSILVVLGVFFGLSLSGCGSTKSPNVEVNVESVSISLDNDANDTMATSVDLVLVYDPDLAKVIGKLDSKTYYATVNQIKVDSPGLIEIYHWELTPGQTINNYPITHLDGADIWAAYVFASYVSKGPHRVRLGSSEHATVHLKALDFCVLEVGCFGAPGSADVSAGESAYQKLLEAHTKVQKVQPLDPRMKISSQNPGREIYNRSKGEALSYGRRHGVEREVKLTEEIIEESF